MADSSGVVPGPQDSLMEEVVEDSTWRLIGMVREGVEDNIMLSRVDIGSWLPLKLLGRCLKNKYRVCFNGHALSYYGEF